MNKILDTNLPMAPMESIAAKPQEIFHELGWLKIVEHPDHRRFTTESGIPVPNTVFDALKALYEESQSPTFGTLAFERFKLKRVNTRKTYHGLIYADGQETSHQIGKNTYDLLAYVHQNGLFGTWLAPQTVKAALNFTHTAYHLAVTELDILTADIYQRKRRIGICFAGNGQKIPEPVTKIEPLKASTPDKQIHGPVYDFGNFTIRQIHTPKRRTGILRVRDQDGTREISTRASDLLVGIHKNNLAGLWLSDQVLIKILGLDTPGLDASQQEINLGYLRQALWKLEKDFLSLSGDGEKAAFSFQRARGLSLSISGKNQPVPAFSRNTLVTDFFDFSVFTLLLQKNVPQKPGIIAAGRKQVRISLDAYKILAHLYPSIRRGQWLESVTLGKQLSLKKNVYHTIQEIIAAFTELQDALPPRIFHHYTHKPPLRPLTDRILLKISKPKEPSADVVPAAIEKSIAVIEKESSHTPPAGTDAEDKEDALPPENPVLEAADTLPAPVITPEAAPSFASAAAATPSGGTTPEPAAADTAPAAPPAWIADAHGILSGTHSLTSFWHKINDALAAEAHAKEDPQITAKVLRFLQNRRAQWQRPDGVANQAVLDSYNALVRKLAGKMAEAAPGKAADDFINDIRASLGVASSKPVTGISAGKDGERVYGSLEARERPYISGTPHVYAIFNIAATLPMEQFVLVSGLYLRGSRHRRTLGDIQKECDLTPPEAAAAFNTAKDALTKHVSESPSMTGQDKNTALGWIHSWTLGLSPSGGR